MKGTTGKRSKDIYAGIQGDAEQERGAAPVGAGHPDASTYSFIEPMRRVMS